MQPRSRVLLVIVLSQFFCTSLWFAGNSILEDLISVFSLSAAVLGYLTSAIQLGFISGTLVFAALTIADRFSPSKVFFLSALMAATFNIGLIWSSNTVLSLIGFRFATGFFLAGIYPVGMKIASDYFQDGLGKSLGLLVGALVLGKAFPFFLKGIAYGFSWQFIVYSTSFLALIGGFLMLIVVADVLRSSAKSSLKLFAFFSVFKSKQFRGAAFGYFGHMWELYTYWAFVPIILQTYLRIQGKPSINIPLVVFLIIGMGSLTCVFGGYLSKRFGVRKVALISLTSSGLCCFLSPLLFSFDSLVSCIVFLVFWGMVVIADSPMFSTLVAQCAPQKLKGTALTIVNCVGFGITIISIQLMSYLNVQYPSIYSYMVLGFGPLFGIYHTLKGAQK